MNSNLISLFLFITIVFGSGGYDHGTSAGKGKWDLSFTWNPFNYFYHGQSYMVLGYGLTDRLDIHGYYSDINKGNSNYYGGLFYQFYKSTSLDISTAVGIRKYINEKTKHNIYCLKPNFYRNIFYSLQFMGGNRSFRRILQGFLFSVFFYSFYVIIV